MNHNSADLVRWLYYTEPDGLTDSEIAQRVGVSRRMVANYRRQLGAIRIAPGRYTLEPGVDEVALAGAVCEWFRRMYT